MEPIRHPRTLSQLTLDLEREHQDNFQGFNNLMTALQTACKIISHAVHVAGIRDLRGDLGETNVQGEKVKKLDHLSNETFINFLTNSGELCCGASEETGDLILPPADRIGDYVVTFDPLDGSSNIDAGVTIGTIFGIYKRVTPKGTQGTEEDALQPAKNFVAAGYTMYGGSTVLVLATKHGVNGFTLDTGIGEFVLSHPAMTVPNRGAYYSVNEGRAKYWDKATTEYVQLAKNGNDDRKSYSLRYIGTMVGDVHRTLCYGGIFFYPADKQAAKGKLRHLYECGPMTFIMHMAGGRGSTGNEDIMDVVPGQLHARIPIFIGSKEDVEDVEKLYKEHSA